MTVVLQKVDHIHEVGVAVHRFGMLLGFHPKSTFLVNR